MVTPTFDLIDCGTIEESGLADEPLGYRLDVLAASAVDAVLTAGGWLYDRVMAGWEVSALIPPGADTRPLRILGVRAVSHSGFRGQGLAVSAAAFTGDAGVRETIRRALDTRRAEVALLGDGWPAGIAHRMDPVPYLPSAAARVFKGHALAAAGIGCGSVDSTESLRGGMARLA